MRSEGTYRLYAGYCRNRIMPAIGGLKLRGLRTAHVQTMLDALASEIKPSTVRDIRAIIIKALGDARKWGDLPKNAPNVAADTEIRPVIQKRPPALNDAQLDRLLAVASGDPMEPLILAALGTGARISELLGLMWANVIYDDAELHIMGALKRQRREGTHKGAQYELIREPYTKTRDQRITRLSAPLAEAFRAQWQRQQQQREAAGQAWQMTGLVFTDDQGRALDPNATSKRFKAIAKRAGLPPDFTFHSLRHSVGTFLIKQGETQRTIAVILGHRSIRTTERYGVVLPEVSRDALDKHAQRLSRRGGEQ